MGERVAACLDRVRHRGNSGLRAVVESSNDFPTAAGLASSASGFAALVVAADAALGLGLGRAELADLARQASGSAARSLYGGFAEIELADRNGVREARTHHVLGPDEWPLRIVVAVVEAGPKAVGSTEGMLRTERTSPYYASWVDSSAADLEDARRAIEGRDFQALADTSESSCLKMHAVMLSARPGLVYWKPATVDCIRLVRALRTGGTPVFFTIDAGPQVKAVCLPDAADVVARELAAVPGVHQVLESGLGEGARVVEG
jgi:diphosphomevalonate decarboxylase